MSPKELCLCRIIELENVMYDQEHINTEEFDQAS